MSGELDYITGPAWDTADGAMEGTIEIEAQMIAIQYIIQGHSVNENREKLKSSIEGA